MSEQTATGLFIRVYPPRWSDHELATVEAWASKVYPHCPVLGSWLQDLWANEAIRRMRASQGTPIEVQAPLEPFSRMTPSELSRCVPVVAALTYSASDYEMGRFFDRLQQHLNAVVQNRLAEAAA